MRFLGAIGGVPKILVPDNPKAAVVKSNPYEPDINKMLENFANHYGCGSARTSAQAERQIHGRKTYEAGLSAHICRTSKYEVLLTGGTQYPHRRKK